MPELLGNLTQLYELRLSCNNLIGNIPASLGNFQSLQILDLSVNNLNGTIPREIFSLPSLGRILNLSSNSLTGEIPIDIGRLKAIQGINFSKNKLSGQIPASVGDCSSLLVLDLSENSFHGTILNSLSNLKGIEFIDLSLNNLSGRIPSSLQSLQFLLVLNLSNNHFEGEVPKEGIFTNLTVVSLNGNPNLCGGVSESVLPKCAFLVKQSDRSNKKLIVGLVVGFTASGILFGLFLLMLWKRSRSKLQEDVNVISFESPHKFYTYHDLRISTSNFDSQNLIGEGSFGHVYKGIMQDGTTAAIKVFNMERHGALKSFLSECEALRNVRHRNLVRIMSACSSSNFKALVLRYMSNGNLEQWLHETNGLSAEERKWFDTEHRLGIAIDVASAMEYLHYDSETPVVHCDLKPSNVLLDEDKIVHVSDFGLARMLFKNQNECPLSSSLGLKGSIGYMAPEYGLGGGVSIKGDTYSYGVLVLEMFTKRRPPMKCFTGELNLQKWVSMALPDRIMDILDPELVQKDGDLIEHCLVSALKIGLTCAQISPEDRPTVRDVTALLKHVKNVFLN